MLLEAIVCMAQHHFTGRTHVLAFKCRRIGAISLTLSYGSTRTRLVILRGTVSAKNQGTRRAVHVVRSHSFGLLLRGECAP